MTFINIKTLIFKHTHIWVQKTTARYGLCPITTIYVVLQFILIILELKTLFERMWR